MILKRSANTVLFKCNFIRDGHIFAWRQNQSNLAWDYIVKKSTGQQQNASSKSNENCLNTFFKRRCCTALLSINAKNGKSSVYLRKTKVFHIPSMPSSTGNKNLWSRQPWKSKSEGRTASRCWLTCILCHHPRLYISYQKTETVLTNLNSSLSHFNLFNRHAWINLITYWDYRWEQSLHIWNFLRFCYDYGSIKLDIMTINVLCREL